MQQLLFNKRGGAGKDVFRPIQFKFAQRITFTERNRFRHHISNQMTVYLLGEKDPIDHSFSHCFCKKKEKKN